MIWEIEKTVDALALRVVVNLAKQNKKEILQLLKKWLAKKIKDERLAMATTCHPIVLFSLLVP